MKTAPKRLSKLQIEEIKVAWENDLKMHERHPEDGYGGFCIEELTRHIAFLEEYIDPSEIVESRSKIAS